MSSHLIFQSVLAYFTVVSVLSDIFPLTSEIKEIMEEQGSNNAIVTSSDHEILRQSSQDTISKSAVTHLSVLSFISHPVVSNPAYLRRSRPETRAGRHTVLQELFALLSSLAHAVCFIFSPSLHLNPDLLTTYDDVLQLFQGR